jgi:hypothetical protein
MMHLGTNDVWNNKSPADITAAFTTLLGQMRDNKKTMKVLVCYRAQSFSTAGNGTALTNWG